MIKAYFLFILTIRKFFRISGSLIIYRARALLLLENSCFISKIKKQGFSERNLLRNQECVGILSILTAGHVSALLTGHLRMSQQSKRRYVSGKTTAEDKASAMASGV